MSFASSLKLVKTRIDLSLVIMKVTLSKRIRLSISKSLSNGFPFSISISIDFSLGLLTALNDSSRVNETPDPTFMVPKVMQEVVAVAVCNVAKARIPFSTEEPAHHDCTLHLLVCVRILLGN